MRRAWHLFRGHSIAYAPPLAPIPAMWHNCSCGRRWLA